MTIAKDARKGNRFGAIKALLIDLDDTLYRNHVIPERVKEAIQHYMVERLGVSADEVHALTAQLYSKYGTTMAGLMAQGYQIDFDDWHKSVHHQALDYQSLLQPDILLRDLLCSIDLPKYILTNADHKHAELCLARLGISDCFKGIYDFEWAQRTAAAKGLLDKTMPVLCKPNKLIYQLALEAMEYEAHQVVFFDDSMRNIASAHECGLRTVLVGADSLIPGSDVALIDMHQLPAALPELLDQPGLVHDRHRHSIELDEEAQQASARMEVVRA